MKKLFFAAAIACLALFAACSTEDETINSDDSGQNDDNGSDDGSGDDGSVLDEYEKITQSYEGTLTVEDAQGVVNHTQEDTTFDFEAAGGFGELVMNEVKFAENMPFPMTITASDIVYVCAGVYQIDSVIPTIAGAPMEDYLLTNVKIEATDSTLVVEFECIGSYAKFTTEVEQVDEFEKISVSETGYFEVLDSEGALSYELTDVVFDFEAANGFGELMMNDIKFTSNAYAPIMTLVVSDIEYVSDGVYASDSAVPSWNGEPYESSVLTDLYVVFVDSKLSVSFAVSNSTVTFVSE